MKSLILAVLVLASSAAQADILKIYEAHFNGVPVCNSGESEQRRAQDDFKGLFQLLKQSKQQLVTAPLVDVLSASETHIALANPKSGKVCDLVNQGGCVSASCMN